MGHIASRKSSAARAHRKLSIASGISTAKSAPPSPVTANAMSGSATTSANHGATDYRPGRSLTRYLPQVALATLLVSVTPVVVVWLLRSAGAIGPWTGLVLAMGLSTALSWFGCAYWKRSKGSGDLLFSELLVWGWLRRWRAERRLASAVELLGLVQSNGGRPAGWSVDRQEELLRALASALEAEDRYTRGHSDRVACYAGSVAREMGLSSGEVEAVRAAALVHDVGKLRIPAEVLNKPTRLTDAEFDLIKRHPVDGAEMVASLGNKELTSVVLHHHERLQRAVSWMTGEATAATITTGNVVATAVATVAIGGVAMTSSVVARVDPIRSAGNAHASARPGHALGQVLGVAQAGGPAGVSPLTGGFSAGIGGARASLPPAWDEHFRAISHATRLTGSITHTAAGGLTRGIDAVVPTGTAPGGGKTVFGRGIGTRGAPRHAAGPSSPNTGDSGSPGVRSTDSGKGKGSPSATSGKGDGHGDGHGHGDGRGHAQS